MEKTGLLAVYEKHNRFGDYLGMDFDLLEPGQIVYRLTVSEHHLATPVAAHGGVVAALMDAVIGVTALSKTYLENRLVSTVEFKISYYRPALLGDRLTGTGHIDFAGKRILHVSGEITNQDGALIAKALGTFNAYPAEKVVAL